MSTPAPRYAEEDPEPGTHGWPEPAPRRPQRLAPGGPSPRRRRSSRDLTWLGLAALGVVLAVVAGIWYLSLDRTAAPTELTVPSVLGLPEATAVQRLTTDGFNVRAVERPGDAKAGRVFQQRPAASSPLARGATVTIGVANGQTP
jgi:hypothetical protein